MMKARTDLERPIPSMNAEDIRSAQLKVIDLSKNNADAIMLLQMLGIQQKVEV